MRGVICMQIQAYQALEQRPNLLDLLDQERPLTGGNTLRL